MAEAEVEELTQAREYYNQMTDLMAEMEADMDKVDRGVKKAGRRVRKAASELSKLCKPFRAAIIDLRDAGDEEE